MSDRFEFLAKGERLLAAIQTSWGRVSRSRGDSPEAERERAAFSELYYGAIFYFTLALVRDRELAAEVTQDFMVGFLRGKYIPKAGKEAGRLREFLKQCLRRLIIDKHRSRRGRREVSMVGRDGAERDLPDAGATPDEVLDRRMTLALVSEARRRAEGRLAGKAHAWEALDLWEFQREDGLTHEGAAKQLGISLADFRNLLKYARRAFIQELGSLLGREVSTYAALDAEMDAIYQTLRDSLSDSWRQYRRPRLGAGEE